MEGPTNTAAGTWGFLRDAVTSTVQGLSCQWIDVTEVDDGTYYLGGSGQLRVHSRCAGEGRNELRQQPCGRMHQPRPIFWGVGGGARRRL